MSAATFGAHHPGETIWHRIPAGWKLVTLFVLGIVVVALRDLRVNSALLVVVFVALFWARTPARSLWRTGRLLILLSLFLLPYHLWRTDLWHGLTIVSGLLALILAASLVTGTTSTDEMVDTIANGLQPFERFGVDPDRVALTFSLIIRAIPTTAELAHQTREAAKARGLEKNLRALTTPLALRVVAHALLTGEALHARGVLDD